MKAKVYGIADHAPPTSDALKSRRSLVCAYIPYHSLHIIKKPWRGGDPFLAPLSAYLRKGLELEDILDFHQVPLAMESENDGA